MRDIYRENEAKKLEVSLKCSSEFKKKLLADNEQLSERLNMLQTMFPDRKIPKPMM